MELKEARFIIFESPNGRDGWKPILPVDVPEWIKPAHVMGRLANGDMVTDPKLTTNWYRAQRVLSEAEQKRVDAANAKRARKAAKLKKSLH